MLLSAQTTDKAVNEATPALFELAPDAATMAATLVPAIEACIKRLGLAPTKARNLQAMAQVGQGAAALLTHSAALALVQLWLFSY